MAQPAVRPALKSALFLSFLAGLSAWYFNEFPLPNFLVNLKALGLLILVGAAACGLGSRLLSLLGIQKFTSAIEEIVFSLTIGFGILSFLMILLGVFHGWTPAGGWTLLLLGLFVSRPFFVRCKRWFYEPSNPIPITRGTLLPWIALSAGILFSFLIAFAPVTFYDSLVYHFALPSAYLKTHHWTGLREMIYSSFPQNLEMLWTLGMLVGNDAVSNLMAWSLAFALLAAVGSFGKRYFVPAVGLWAAALVAVMPAFLLLSSGGYVDIGLALFSFMALYSLCNWIQNSCRGMLVLCGFFAGWAMGTKYTGAISTVLIGAMVLIKSLHPMFLLPLGEKVGMRGILPPQASPSPMPSPPVGRGIFQNDWLKNLSLYAVAVFAMFSPWLIKNLIYVGNPVFPFFYQGGIQKLNPWLPAAAAGYFRGIMEYHPRTLPQLLALFVQIPLRPLGFGGGADVLGDLGWAPFLWFLPALWLCARHSSATRLLLGFALFFFIPWGMSRPVLRFLLPLLPVLAVLVGVAWVEGIGAQPAWTRWIAGTFLSGLVVSGVFLFFWAAGTFDYFPVSLGLEDREHYLTRKLNYYGAASFTNTNLPENARLFIVGDQRGYYYQRNIMLRPVFNENPLVQWADGAASPAALRQRLKQEGLTHLVVNHAEMERLRRYHASDFTARGETNWDRLQSQLGPPLYHDRFCDVLAL